MCNCLSSGSSCIGCFAEFEFELVVSEFTSRLTCAVLAGCWISVLLLLFFFPFVLVVSESFFDF